MRRLLLPALTLLCLLALGETAHAQWPALYFRADPLLRLDLSRRSAGTSFALSTYRYEAGAYFDGRDKTPHSSVSEFPMIAYEREEFVFSGVFGLSKDVAAVIAAPVSHASQRYHETGEWGIERLWLGGLWAVDRARHFSLLGWMAVDWDGPTGNLLYAVGDDNGSSLAGLQFVLASGDRSQGPEFYLRGGAAVHLRKDRWFNRRLYEFPGEFRFLMPVTHRLALGGGIDGHFVVGHQESLPFIGRYTSHDAFAIGPDLSLRLTPEIRLHAVFRDEIIGYYASAGVYWNVALAITPFR
jgi:hypothetical protein